MKGCVVILSLLCLSIAYPPAVAGAPQASPARQTSQTTAPAPSAPENATYPPRIDPNKEAAIRQLMQMAGGTAVVNQVMDGVQKNMKPMMARALPPGEYREKLIDLFFEKFRSEADVQQLMDLNIQIYDKYLSYEDIQGLIQFYSTPLGQKAMSVMPKLTVEAQSEGMKWGENLGRKAMKEVLTEHPELAKGLEEAVKAAQSK